MYDKGRLIKNSAFSLFSKLMLPVLTLLTVLLIAKYLGVGGLGNYTVVLSLYTIFQFVTCLGIQPVLIREIAADREKSGPYFASAVVATFTSSCLAFVVSLLVSLFFLNNREVAATLPIASLGLLPSGFIYTTEALVVAHGRNELVVKMYALENLSKVLLSVAALLLGYGLKTLVVIIAVTRLAAFLYCLLIVRKVFLFRPIHGFQMNNFRELLKMIPVFSALYILAIIFLRIDVVLISWLKGDYITGLYCAAYRFLAILIILPESFMTAVYPVLSRMYIKEDGLNIGEMCAKTVKYLFILSVPIIIFLTFFSEEVVRLLFGHQYARSAEGVVILAWAALPFIVHAVFGQALQAVHKQNANLKILIASILFTIIVTYILIMRFELSGAYYAALFSSLFHASLNYVYFIRCVDSCHIMKNSGKLFLFCILGLITALLVPPGFFSHFRVAAYIAWALFYVSALFFCNIIDSKERELFRTLLADHAKG